MKRTPLFHYHKDNSKLIEFAEFEMPLWFKGISEEHLTVRESLGLFDVSHMGRFLVKGKDATDFLNYLLPTDVLKVSKGRSFYTVFCNGEGGIVDDSVILKREENEYLVIGNAINIEKDWNWLKKHAKSFDVELNNLSDDSAMLALQGPKAEEVLQTLVKEDLKQIKRFSNFKAKIEDLEVIISRTGYTGEDGFEIIIFDVSYEEPQKALNLWNLLLSKGALPCGLGARDTLRLEAGMCLYGNDIDESVNPLEANLSWIVSFDKGDYLGREALIKVKEKGVKRLRKGFLMEDRGIPRAKCKILKDEEEVGIVSSGTFSPLLKKGIAQGYIKASLSKDDELVQIDIRGIKSLARVKTPPLYDTNLYGWKRIKV
ncbi:MAG: glycine cleavage system aminomethyltransferase GcvT [Nitrososphaerales archaeon]